MAIADVQRQPLPRCPVAREFARWFVAAVARSVTV